jgi:hypothetical protein
MVWPPQKDWGGPSLSPPSTVVKSGNIALVFIALWIGLRIFRIKEPDLIKWSQDPSHIQEIQTATGIFRASSGTSGAVRLVEKQKYSEN